MRSVLLNGMFVDRRLKQMCEWAARLSNTPLRANRANRTPITRERIHSTITTPSYNYVAPKSDIWGLPHVLGMRRFAFTLSSSCSFVSLWFGCRFLAASHLRNSSLVHVSGSPEGSASRGNISWPHMLHAATAVTIPPNARKVFLEFNALSKGVGILKV